jgi:ABC-type Zn uptake system ZnuABC Zn-binding protein ZnuA
MRDTALQLSLQHLKELKCITHHPNNGYLLAAYGREIMLAVSEADSE